MINLLLYKNNLSSLLAICIFLELEQDFPLMIDSICISIHSGRTNHKGYLP